jgi:hypothetical protein
VTDFVGRHLTSLPTIHAIHHSFHFESLDRHNFVTHILEPRVGMQFIPTSVDTFVM